jgi:hypothetical protein
MSSLANLSDVATLNNGGGRKKSRRHTHLCGSLFWVLVKSSELGINYTFLSHLSTN